MLLIHLHSMIHGARAVCIQVGSLQDGCQEYYPVLPKRHKLDKGIISEMSTAGGTTLTRCKNAHKKHS